MAPFTALMATETKAPFPPNVDLAVNSPHQYIGGCGGPQAGAKSCCCHSHYCCCFLQSIAERCILAPTCVPRPVHPPVAAAAAAHVNAIWLLLLAAYCVAAASGVPASCPLQCPDAAAKGRGPRAAPFGAPCQICTEEAQFCLERRGRTRDCWSQRWHAAASQKQVLRQRLLTPCPASRG